MGRGFSPLWLSSTWDLNSAVTLSFLSCVVSLPRAEKPWLQSEQRQATGFPSIFSVTINCGIYSASHRWAVSGCAILLLLLLRLTLHEPNKDFNRPASRSQICFQSVTLPF